MSFSPRSVSPTLLCLALLLVAAPRANALLNFDGSRNQIFVFGGVTFSHSSNLFSERDGQGDYFVTAEAGVDLKRRAGLISVDATLKLDYSRYGEFTDQNALNPNFTIEFAKTAGRVTGSLKLSAYRETRSDSAVNLRTSAWNVPVTLGLRYPINEKLYVTSDTGYLRRTFAANQGLVNYHDYSEAVDLYYTYTSKLDLFAGYRVRSGYTSVGGHSLDHWFSVGATGGILAKLTGTVRIGYQIRDLNEAGDGPFHQFNALAGLSWPITRKLMLSLQAVRDFNTIATGATVDTTSLTLGAVYAINRKVDINGSVSVGRNRFLNFTQNDRRDNFYGWNAGVRYRPNEHFQVGASFTYLKNSSSLSLAEFDNQGYSVDITTRF